MRVWEVPISNLSQILAILTDVFSDFSPFCPANVSVIPMSRQFPSRYYQRLGLPSGLFPSGFPTNILYGRAKAQAVSRWFPTAGARVQSRV
jgi:hypothetical protein